MAKHIPIGIDLGTSRSLISYIDAIGRPRIIEDLDDQTKLTPSVIMFDKEDDGMVINVGEIAKRSAVSHPGDVIRIIKSHMHKPDWKWEDSSGKVWTPATLSALILKKLKTYAEKTLHENQELDQDAELTHAVISVPYYFGSLERERTKEAGIIAGFEVLKIVDEPVAAAISFGLNEETESSTNLIYDLGGGTFDIAVAKVDKDSKIDIIGTHGHTQLGGAYFDMKICEYFQEEFQKAHNIDPLHDLRIYQDFLEKAENAKETLCRIKTVNVTLSAEGKVLDLEFTREKFEELIQSDLDDTANLLDETLVNLKVNREIIPENKLFKSEIEALEAQKKAEGKKITKLDEFNVLAKIKDEERIVLNKLRVDAASDETKKQKWDKIITAEWSKIDRILLVGGSTKIPAVQNMLKKVSGKDPQVLTSPDEAVALGAGILAAWQHKKLFPDIEGLPVVIGRKGKTKEKEIKTKVSHSLGIKTLGFDGKRSIMEADALDPDPSITLDDLKMKEKEYAVIEVELGEGKKLVARSSVSLLVKEIEECIKRGDQARASEKMEELSRLIEDIRPMKLMLKPAKTEFFDRARQLRGKMKEHKSLFSNYDEILENITVNENEASKAYAENDQQALTVCDRNLSGQEEHVEQRINHNNEPSEEPPLNILVPIWARQFIGLLVKLKANCNDASMNRETDMHIAILRSIPDFFPTVEEARVHTHKILRANFHCDLMIRSLGIGDNSSGVPGAIGDTSLPGIDTDRVSSSSKAPKSIKKTVETDKNGDQRIPVHVTDRVSFSITAPAIMVPGYSYVIDLWAHIGRQRMEVLKRAQESVANKKVQIKTKGPVSVSRGTILNVHITMNELIIEDPEDTIIWEGEIGNASFPVTVPDKIKPGSYGGKATIYADALQIAKLYFTIKIGNVSSEKATLPVDEKRYKLAFASYASHDRVEVLNIILGIQKAVPDLDIFLDVKSLRSGERYEKVLLHKIEQSDIFYLFWSKAASQSKWVDKEWRHAYVKKGVEYIDPVPLDDPREVPPPKELQDKLHFYDWTLPFKEQSRRINGML